MNEERISYDLGYDAVGRVREMEPRLDFGMAPFLKEPKNFYVVPQPDEIRYRQNRKAWFDGYLDRSLEIGGSQAKAAMNAYSRHYPLDIKQETVPGKQYTLFFEQTDTYKRYNHQGHASNEVLKKVPLPALRLDVSAGSFPRAIRQAWATIAGGDTSLLAGASLMGVYLPTNLNDPLKNLLHRYYNAAINVDVCKQKLASPARQFLRDERNSRKVSDFAEQERYNLAGYKAVERELSDMYKSMSGNRPPPLSDIFLIAYVEDIVRGLPISQQKTDLRIMLDDYEYSGNRDHLASFVYEGIMPDGGIYADIVPIWEWNLHDEYFLTDNSGWSPLQETHDEVRIALRDAKDGNTEKLDHLLETCKDMRPLAVYANELMEAGCIEAVDKIMTTMDRKKVPYTRGYLSERNQLELDAWKDQRQALSPGFC